MNPSQFDKLRQCKEFHPRIQRLEKYISDVEELNAEVTAAMAVVEWEEKKLKTLTAVVEAEKRKLNKHYQTRRQFNIRIPTTQINNEIDNLYETFDNFTETQKQNCVKDEKNRLLGRLHVVDEKFKARDIFGGIS